MRAPVDDAGVRRLAAELGRVAPAGSRLYLTGGATAVAYGWRERSRSRFSAGNLTVLDFDLYAQALSKVERGFELDLADVRSMLAAGLVEPARLRELLAAIEPDLHRFPQVDAASFRARLERVLER